MRVFKHMPDTHGVACKSDLCCNGGCQLCVLCAASEPCRKAEALLLLVPQPAAAIITSNAVHNCHYGTMLQSNYNTRHRRGRLLVADFSVLRAAQLSQPETAKQDCQNCTVLH
jgi:hypothetical protein